MRDYTYRVTVPPANLAVSLATFKSHIKQTSTAEDSLLTLYLEAAIDYAEKFTRRDFITRTYETFRDFFPRYFQNEGYYPGGYVPSSGIRLSADTNAGFELRRSPLQSVTSIQYLVDGVLTLVDSNLYYNTVEEDYSEILALDSWPTNGDNRLQSITITFITGFGDDDTDVPSDIKRAIIGHATALWANRGDCDDESQVPNLSKRIYLQNRIEKL